jgi:hypothetical protein
LTDLSQYAIKRAMSDRATDIFECYEAEGISLCPYCGSEIGFIDGRGYNKKYCLSLSEFCRQKRKKEYALEYRLLNGKKSSRKYYITHHVNKKCKICDKLKPVGVGNGSATCGSVKCKAKMRLKRKTNNRKICLPTVRVCKFCKSVFTSIKYKKYCSISCKVKNKSKTSKTRDNVIRFCKKCGNLLIVGRSFVCENCKRETINSFKRKYYSENKNKINFQNREWRKNNHDAWVAIMRRRNNKESAAIAALKEIGVELNNVNGSDHGGIKRRQTVLILRNFLRNFGIEI